MKLRLVFNSFLCVLTMLSFAPALYAEAASKAKAVWIEDIDEAFRLAKDQKKQVFVDFTGSDWCYWCILADKNIFTTKEWAEFSGKMVCLKVDFPQQAAKKPSADVQLKRREFAKEFGIRGFPTFVLASPDRREIARFSAGKKRAGEFIEEVKKVLERK
jgi:protein disulfide-isomerase